MPDFLQDLPGQDVLRRASIVLCPGVLRGEDNINAFWVSAPLSLLQKEVGTKHMPYSKKKT